MFLPRWDSKGWIPTNDQRNTYSCWVLPSPLSPKIPLLPWAWASVNEQCHLEITHPPAPRPRFPILGPLVCFQSSVPLLGGILHRQSWGPSSTGSPTRQTQNGTHLPGASQQHQFCLDSDPSLWGHCAESPTRSGTGYSKWGQTASCNKLDL